jgi:hypothetical protein
MLNRTNIDQLVFEWALDDVLVAYLYQPLKAIERSQILKILRWMCQCQHVPTVVELSQQIQERSTQKVIRDAELLIAIRRLQKVVMQRQKNELFEWAQILRRLSRNYIAIAFWRSGTKYRRGPQSRRERTRKRNELVQQALDVDMTDPNDIFNFILKEDASLLKGRNGKLMTPASVMLQFKRQKSAKDKGQKSVKHQN